MARPTKLTADLKHRIYLLLKAGNYVKTAVQAVGITPATHYNWMAKAALIGDTPPAELKGQALKQAAARVGLEKSLKAAEKRERLAQLHDYRESVEFALAEAEAEAVELVTKAAKDDWRAAAWYLERAYPEKFAKAPPKVRSGGVPDPPPDTGGSDADEPEAADGDQAGL